MPEKKVIPPSLVMLSIKRSELLLEMILSHTVAARYEHLSVEDKQVKVLEAIGYVDSDLSSFVASLQDAE